MTAADPPASAAPHTIAVILNPAAHSAKARKHVDRVRTLAAGAHFAETQAAGDARRLARTLAEEGWSTVVAAGGDGTVNEVVAGLLEAEVGIRPSLGLLPMGTMNVFALELGLPVLSLEGCWNRVVAGRTREIDVWRAGAHPFVQMAGVGVDAQVIRHTTWEAKKQWGPLSYLSTLTQVLDRPPAEVRVRVDDSPWLTGSSVLLGNGRYYGGPFAVFHGAVNDDGLIDIALVHGHGPATFSNLIADVLLQEHDEAHDRLTRLRGRRVLIEAPEAVPFEIDGELGGETPLIVTRHESRLRVTV
jgi:YegS/Rv2252/BmrU family lipid kinase